MSRATQADVSVFSINGTDFLALFKSVSLTANFELADGRALPSRDPRNDEVKRSVSFATGIMTNVNATVSTSSRVNNLDVSELLIGTTNYISFLRMGSITVNNNFAEGSGVNDLFRVPIWTTRNITASVTLGVGTSAFHTALGGLVDAASNGGALALSVSINGVTLAVPMIVSSYEHGFADDEIQTLTLSFEQRGAPTTTPATTNILGYAITSPGTGVACALTSRSANGSAYAGNFIFNSASFSFNDAEIISTEYNLSSTGAITQA